MQRVAVASAIVVLTACNVDSAPPDDQLVSPVPFQLGLVSGAFYDEHAQPFKTDAPQIMCELDQLGARWLRIEAAWRATSNETYQTIIREAHLRGIKVLGLVNDWYCGSEAPGAPDAWIAGYVQKLAMQLDGALAGVDAVEILNEPNGTCKDGGWLVGPNAFSWLLRRVWEWKSTRPDLSSVAIVAGAPVDTNIHDPWWQGLLRSGAWEHGVRPFDYIGVHPYNASHFRDGTWKSFTISGLRDVSNLYWGLTGVQTPLIATEIGWQAPCSGHDMCVATDDQVAVAMQVAADAMRESGVVAAALWYDYRNDEEGADMQQYGLRARYDAAAGRYPAKMPVWNEFAELAGRLPGDPEQCWPPPRHSVHRAFSASLGDHFYTFDRNEAPALGYTVEAYDYFELRDGASPDTTPLWRCYSASATDHLYTTSPTCDGRSDMVRENSLGYIATSPLTGTRALYRLSAPGDHFYTLDTGEITTATALGYAYEGVAGYVW